MIAATVRVLAISGSLRAASSNTAALGALRAVAPPGVVVTIYDGLRTLPAFDPDDDGPRLPAPVATLRGQVAAADALVISSPEYARGIAGSLKNALDWLVGGPEMPGKRVAVLNTSPRAIHAPAALRLVLATMSATVVEEACLTLPLLGQTTSSEAVAQDLELAGMLRHCLAALLASLG